MLDRISCKFSCVVTSRTYLISKICKWNLIQIECNTLPRYKYWIHVDNYRDIPSSFSFIKIYGTLFDFAGLSFIDFIPKRSSDCSEKRILYLVILLAHILILVYDVWFHFRILITYFARLLSGRNNNVLSLWLIFYNYIWKRFHLGSWTMMW